MPSPLHKRRAPSRTLVGTSIAAVAVLGPLMLIGQSSSWFGMTAAAFPMYAASDGVWEENPATMHEVWVPIDLCTEPWIVARDTSIDALAEDSSRVYSYDASDLGYLYDKWKDCNPGNVPLPPFEPPSLPPFDGPIEDPTCAGICDLKLPFPGPITDPSGPDPWEHCAGINCPGMPPAFGTPGGGCGGDGSGGGGGPCAAIVPPGCDPPPPPDPNPTLPEPPASPPPSPPVWMGSGSTTFTSYPVNPVSGHKHERNIDLIVRVTGRPFTVSRSYTSDPGFGGSGLAGHNWSMNVFYFLHKEASGAAAPLTMHIPGSGARTFYYDGDDAWTLTGASQQRITKTSVEIDGQQRPVFRLSEPGVWEADFLRANESGENGGSWTTTPLTHLGLMIQQRDLYGNAHTYSYAVLHPDTQDEVARLDTIYLNGTSSTNCEASVHFSWNQLNNENLGRLAQISVKRYPTGGSGIVVERVDYTYKRSGDGFSSDLGSGGNLVQVVKSTRVDRSESTAHIEGGAAWNYSTQQFRYHTSQSGEISGEEIQLKMLLQAEQIEFAAQRHFVSQSTTGTVKAFAQSLLSMSDGATAYSVSGESASVEDLAEKVIGYESSSQGSRVAVQYIQAGCGCGGSGSQTRLTYEYIDFDSLTDPQYAQSTIVTHERWDDGVDAFVPYLGDYYDVLQVTIEAEPPGQQAVQWKQSYVSTTAQIELDGQGQPISGRTWARHSTYDLHNRPHRVASPSAVATYQPAVPGTPPQEPSITMRTDAGMVVEYTYTDAHQPKEMFIQRGQSGQRSLIRELTYGDNDRPWLVTKMQTNEIVGSTEISGNPLERQTVEYSYSFHHGDAISRLETIFHAEPSAENGIVDAALYQHSFYDDRGRMIWSRRNDDTLVRREFDEATGQVALVESNAAPNGTLPQCTGCQFSGSWSGRHAEGGSLAMTYDFDDLGRLRQISLLPANSNLDPRVTRFVREMRYHDDSRYHDNRPGIAFYSLVTLPHAFEDDEEDLHFANPATVLLFNAHQEAVATSRYVMQEGGSGHYGDIFSGYEYSFAAADDVSRSTVDHALNGLVLSSTQWHDLDGHGDNEGYYVTEYGYDSLGRLSTITTPNGTVTEYIRDVLGRTIEVHEGTTTQTPLLTTTLEYDGGFAGDGNLSKVIAHVDDSETRETLLHYDDRNRLVAVENPQSPHLFIVHDNLNRIAKWALFSELPSGFEPVDIDDMTVRDNRGAYGEILYNRRSLPYRERLAIDAGATNPEFLENDSWFDAAGRIASQAGPNSPASKMLYTALGQIEQVFVVAEGGNPADIANDIVFEQAEYTYREGTGELDLVTTRVRTHDADDTLTGDLSTWNGGSADKVITSYSGLEYDDAGRIIQSVEFGTNSANGFASGGTAPQFDSGTYPPRWDTSIGQEPITVKVHYNDRGLIERVIDPREREISIWYDDLNRRIATVENHVSPQLNITWDSQANRWQVSGNSSQGDEDRVTSFVYRLTDNVVEQVAHTFEGANPAVQVTRYAYGTVAGSGAEASRISSNDLLREIRYPDRDTGEPGTAAADIVSFAYNRLGEIRFTKDQNETSHTYIRDAMGRVTEDIAAIAGGSPIDDAIDRIKVVYDELGRPSVIESLKGTTVKNAVEMTYTPLWQVQDIYQEHAGSINGNTPKLTYTYDTQPAGSGNYSRPVEMQYPASSSVLEAIYNNAGSGQPPSVDHIISRLRSMKLNDQSVVAYDFIGTAMPAIVEYPEPDVELNYWLAHNATGTTGVYPGFDRFGRTVRHKWVDGEYGSHGENSIYLGLPSIPSIVELAYVYDKASNILEKYDARPGAKQALNHQYVYDGLNRLTEAKRGSGFDTGFTQAVGSQQWTLDHLGNHLDFNTDLTGNGQYTGTDDLQIAGTYNFANEIEELTKSEDGSPVQLPFSYDDAGNMRSKGLTADSSLVFTHDAWNRLVAVRRVSTHGTTPDRFAEYHYNGLHQRIAKRLDTSEPGTSGYGDLDQQHQYFYTAAWQIAEELVDTSWAEVGPASIDQTIQYVWGIRYIDDIILRHSFAPGGLNPEGGDGNFTHYHLTDHQFSTIALIDNSAKLIERVTYDAYGQARHHWAADITGNGAVGRDDQTAMSAALIASIGQSDYNVDADITRTGTVNNDDLLFTNTLNFKAALPKGVLSAPENGNTVGYAGYVFNAEIPGGLYTVRFRHYDPGLGRWLERDPQGYLDGMSLYGYVQGNSTSAMDPYGLATFYKRTGDGRYWPITEEEARKILEENGFIYSKDKTGRMKKAKRFGRQQWGNKSVVHSPHSPGEHVHVQHKNGGRGHINVLPAGAAGLILFLNMDAKAQGTELGKDLMSLFTQLSNTSDYWAAYGIALEIAARLAKTTGWFGYDNAEAILEAWMQYREAVRSRSQSDSGKDSGEEWEVYSDWGPNGPPQEDGSDCW